MRRLLLAAAGLTLLAPAALVPMARAQTPPGPAAAPPPVAGQPVPGQPMAAPPPAPGPMADMPPPPPPPPPPGGPRGRGGPDAPPPPPPPRGAHIRLERGDARIDVKCADQDTTQACATVVYGLLDKLAAMPAAPARN